MLNYSRSKVGLETSKPIDDLCPMFAVDIRGFEVHLIINTLVQAFTTFRSANFRVVSDRLSAPCYIIINIVGTPQHCCRS